MKAEIIHFNSVFFGMKKIVREVAPNQRFGYFSEFCWLKFFLHSLTWKKNIGKEWNNKRSHGVMARAVPSWSNHLSIHFDGPRFETASRCACTSLSVLRLRLALHLPLCLCLTCDHVAFHAGVMFTLCVSFCILNSTTDKSRSPSWNVDSSRDSFFKSWSLSRPNVREFLCRNW